MDKGKNKDGGASGVQRYLRIARLIQSKQSKQLSHDDYKFFSQFTFDVDQEAINKLQDEKEFKGMSKEEVDSALRQSFFAAVQDPEYRDKILTSAQDLEQKETQSKVAAGINLALGATDVLTSAGQIKNANRLQANLKAPQHPATLTKEPLLDRALSDAGRPSLDAARAMSPAQLQILDQYLSDLNTAKTVSGGQAGVYGALGQEASARRGRRSAELAPIYDNIVSRGEQRYDQLLQQKLQQNHNIQQSQAQFYPTDVNQYNNQLQAVGQLGSTGRQNLRSSIGAFSSFLPSVVSELGTRKRFRDVYNSSVLYGHDNAMTIAEADKVHRNNYEQDYGQNDYNTLEQIYQGY